MADPPIRMTREVEQLPGIGGTLEFKWLNSSEFPGTDTLYVKRWRILRRFITVRLPMSSGKGSLQYRRVADGFDFLAAVDLDLTPIRVRDSGPGPFSQPFADGRLEGPIAEHFSVSMKFLCGDPTFVSHPPMRGIGRPSRTFPRGSDLLDGVYYSCKEVTLDTVECLNSSGGDDVVEYLIAGHGSAPLRRNAPAWTGTGAFGLAESLAERE